MFDFLKPSAPRFSPQQIARSFRWLGWAGFWLQVLLGVIPLLVVVVNVVFKLSQWKGSGIIAVLWLAIGCISILIFSIYWCFYYTRLAKRLETRDFPVAKSAIVPALKLGLLANLGMIAIAVSVALWRVGALTVKMMTIPQGAMVVAPGQMGSSIAQGTLITPADMIAIQAMVNTIAAGLVGAVIALLLIFQIGRHREVGD